MTWLYVTEPCHQSGLTVWWASSCSSHFFGSWEEWAAFTDTDDQPYRSPRPNGHAPLGSVSHCFKPSYFVIDKLRVCLCVSGGRSLSQSSETEPFTVSHVVFLWTRRLFFTSLPVNGQCIKIALNCQILKRFASCLLIGWSVISNLAGNSRLNSNS